MVTHQQVTYTTIKAS